MLMPKPDESVMARREELADALRAKEGGIERLDRSLRIAEVPAYLTK